MIRLRRSDERGHANHGWLDTYHTFSFNTYRDPEHMGFRTLRVINEDRVAPGQGFGTHPHNDMEIITYVLEGALEHKDSLGNGSIIKPGDVQRMSAGTGVFHSEFNPSRSERVHLLQIWIRPAEKGLEPSYEQTAFSDEAKRNRLCLVASPDGSEGSVRINQDARLYATILETDVSLDFNIETDRHLWIQVTRGSLKVGDQTLAAGDGAAVSDETAVTLQGIEEAEALVFDLS